MIQSSNLVLAAFFILMLSSALTSTAGTTSIIVTADYTQENINKLKVVHVINTIAQPVLLKTYQYLKPFSDATSIKDHLIGDKHMTLKQFEKEFTPTMRNIIDSKDASGEDYDISLLIKCIRILSEIYEPDRQWKWNNEHELECRCQKLASKRNSVFHTSSGLSISEMTDEIKSIETLLSDILVSLEKRFPLKKSELSDMTKEVLDQTDFILTHSLETSETCLLQVHLNFLMAEIPSYKIRCKDFGKVKLLDFLSGSRISHDIKLLFTEMVVEKSDTLNKHTSVNYADILKMAKSFSILLIDSEAGGGKTTIVHFKMNDWGEGGLVMNTAGYDFIFAMSFRNPFISTIADLVLDLIPNVKKNIGFKYIMNCLSDPSLNILFLCDGYDEQNKNSKKLFAEIRNLTEKYQHVKVVVTSRPESVKEFYHSKGKKLSVEHIKLLGIHESKRSEFLEKHHNELISAGLSKQSTEDLLRFYDSCSSHHQDLYRLPINLVILSWLWGQAPDKVKTIKSAAGLYTAIMDILNEKLIGRIVESHSDVMDRLNDDLDELSELIDKFKKMVYDQSLVALRFDRIFINDTGVKGLRDLCKKIILPYKELKGAYLLAKLKWVNGSIIKESLEVPHKGLLDFYAAKSIETELCENLLSSGNSIKDILLKYYGTAHKDFEVNKFQNVLQLLGGILALKDVSLVEKHGKEIITLLIESGVRNNRQWYDVYHTLNVNDIAAERFARLIVPHLDHDRVHIDDANVEIIATLIKYVNIPKIDKIDLKKQHDLSFLSKCTSINICYLLYFFRNLHDAAHIMSSCEVRTLTTCVAKIEDLPKTVKHLMLGIMADPVSKMGCDPGLSRLNQHCPELQRLDVHLKPTTGISHLPRLPDLKDRNGESNISLWLSQVTDDSHVLWSIDAARTLLPRSGFYRWLYLPSCGLSVGQLVALVKGLSAVGVRLRSYLIVSSPHSPQQESQLEAATATAHPGCTLVWYDNDDTLPGW